MLSATAAIQNNPIMKMNPPSSGSIDSKFQIMLQRPNSSGSALGSGLPIMQASPSGTSASGLQGFPIMKDPPTGSESSSASQNFQIMRQNPSLGVSAFQSLPIDPPELGSSTSVTA
jgi:hypothetical protein